MHFIITPKANDGGKHLNYNSEIELGQSQLKEFDSDDENFLTFEMPKHIPEVPACNCIKNEYCDQH